MKRHLPNALTCLNLLCGCLALTLIFQDELVLAAYLIGVAAVADFFDGLVARALRVSSPIGKDLDSLADMVSFGVVPGAILFSLLGQSIYKSCYLSNPDFQAALAADKAHTWGGSLLMLARQASQIPSLRYLALVPLFGFCISIFSALRLAKFNNDTRQTNSFIGLPTPACTLVVASLPLVLASNEWGEELEFLILNPWLLLGLTVLLSGLLVAELPLFALKFKNLRWRGNRRRFIFVGLALGLVGWLQAAGVPLAVLLYVLLSVPGRVRSRDLPEAEPVRPQ